MWHFEKKEKCIWVFLNILSNSIVYSLKKLQWTKQLQLYKNQHFHFQNPSKKTFPGYLISPPFSALTFSSLSHFPSIFRVSLPSLSLSDLCLSGLTDKIPWKIAKLWNKHVECSENGSLLQQLVESLRLFPGFLLPSPLFCSSSLFPILFFLELFCCN